MFPNVKFHLHFKSHIRSRTIRSHRLKYIVFTEMFNIKICVEFPSRNIIDNSEDRFRTHYVVCVCAYVCIV